MDPARIGYGRSTVANHLKTRTYTNSETCPHWSDSPVTQTPVSGLGAVSEELWLERGAPVS
ncbi:hypothetical protein GCM10017621_27930 [Maricaulis virginensis]|uniref:Uncharacterized protein n=1 Tax=Maricaulis virginensis TaxID=144022 RepID=A0A9W6IQ44_9PROT|nr:hypothetical protein GCM10017621_27930 [Maricaulis virginensis]